MTGDWDFSGAEVLEWLRRGVPIAAPTVLIVAHPDDETLGLGGRLGVFASLTLVHLTDGAPRDPSDALRAGFPDRDGYRRQRASELEQALARLGVRAGRVALGLEDQGAAFHLSRLARTIADLLGCARIVITHAYEGGHPDHDAAAFAVQAACALRERGGRPPPLRLEFAGYHQGREGRVTGRFWPDAGGLETKAELDPLAVRRKREALASFRSQAGVLAWFDPAQEAYRIAPTYDFRRPPPPGRALYDDWGWRLTSARWREHAHRAAVGLSLEAAECV